jgi:hypothetical protein
VCGVVNDVDQAAKRLSLAPYGLIDRRVVGSCDGQSRASKVSGTVRALDDLDLSTLSLAT